MRKKLLNSRKVLLIALVPNLADKNSLNRNDALNAIDKISEQVGASYVISIVGPSIAVESPE